MKLEATIDGLKKEELQALLVYAQKRLEQLIAEEQQRAREEVEALRAKTEEEVRAKLEVLGHVVELPDSEFDAATAVMSCAPAYLALAVEAIADAGAKDGLDEDVARELVVETTAGTAELLRQRHPADVRKAVAAPGGSTEAGLEALDRDLIAESRHHDLARACF